MLAEKSGDNYRAFVPELMPSVRERLGDSHDEVVERTQELLLLLMESVSSPQAVMDFLVPCFSHRAWRIRQNTLALLEQAVNKCVVLFVCLFQMFCSSPLPPPPPSCADAAVRA